MDQAFHGSLGEFVMSTPLLCRAVAAAPSPAQPGSQFVESCVVLIDIRKHLALTGGGWAL